MFTFLADGTIYANFTSPNNNTYTDLCARALPPLPPVPPPIPTASILSWLDNPVGCFVHFNMATAAGTQGCGGGAPPPINTWAPTALDTDQWVQTCKSMGGSRIIYVAKHGCGFATWKSNVTLNGYAYSITNSSYPEIDVVTSLVESAKKGGIKYGFYYSVVSNAYCNVQNGQVQPGPINPSLQINVTQAEYEAIVIAHMTELNSQFGPLVESKCYQYKKCGNRTTCKLEKVPVSYPPPSSPGFTSMYFNYQLTSSLFTLFFSLARRRLSEGSANPSATIIFYSSTKHCCFSR